MSHFPVLVAAQNEQELAAKLLPFHEYECTGFEEYLEFVPADMDKLTDDYIKYATNCTFDEFTKEEGYDKVDGVYGHYTNPNKKWDGWVVGGRWKDRVFCGDTAIIGDLDIPAIRAAEQLNAEGRWLDFVSAFGDLYAVGIFALRFAFPVLRFLKQDPRKGWEWLDKVKKPGTDGKSPHFDFSVEPGDWRGRYIERQGGALTWAMVTPEGEWVQQADMGWWAMYSNYDRKYARRFWRELEQMDPGQQVYVVDCHI